MDGATSSNKERGQAEPTRPRRVGRWEAWLRRTLAFRADGLPTSGRRSSDRRLFRRPSPALPLQINDNLFASFASLRFFWVRGLRVFGFATSALALCPSSVSLCLCGFPNVEIESPRGFPGTHPDRSVAVRAGVAAKRSTNGVGLCGRPFRIRAGRDRNPGCRLGVGLCRHHRRWCGRETAGRANGRPSG